MDNQASAPAWATTTEAPTDASAPAWATDSPPTPQNNAPVWAQAEQTPAWAQDTTSPLETYGIANSIAPLLPDKIMPSDQELGKVSDMAKNSTIGLFVRAGISDIARRFGNDNVANSWLPLGLQPYNYQDAESGKAETAVDQLINTTHTQGQQMFKLAGNAFIHHPIDTSAYILHELKSNLSSGVSSMVAHPENSILEMGVGLGGNPLYWGGLGTEGLVVKAGEGIFAKMGQFVVKQTANAAIIAPLAAATSVLQQVGQTGKADPATTAQDTLSATATATVLHLATSLGRGLRAAKLNTDSAYNVDSSPSAKNSSWGGLMDPEGNEEFEQFNTYTSPLKDHIEAVNDAVSVAPRNPSIELGKNQEAEILETASKSPDQLTKTPVKTLTDFAQQHNVVGENGTVETPSFYWNLRDKFLNNMESADGWLREQLAGRVGNRVQLAKIAEAQGESFDPNDLKEELLPKDIEEQWIADKNADFNERLNGKDPNAPFRSPRGQEGGFIDPRAAATLAGIVAGTAYGFSQNGFQGALTGGVGGGAIVAIPAFATEMGAAFNRSLRGDPGLFHGQIQPFLEKWDGDLADLSLKVSRFQAMGRLKFTPEEATQMEQFKQGNPDVPESALNPKQKAYLLTADRLLKQVGASLQRRGLINEPIHDYWARTFETTDDTPKDVGDFFREGDAAKLSPSSRHFMSRTLANGWSGVEEARVKLGLKLKDQDAISNLGNYLHSASRAIINFDMYRDLRRLKDNTGTPLVLSSADKVPGNYREITGKYLNRMQGIVPREAAGMGGEGFVNRNLTWYAHPAMSEFLNFLSDAKKPGPLLAALDAGQFAIKRNILFSWFHPKTLTQHQIIVNFTLKNGVQTFEDAAQVLAGTHPIFKQVLYGKSGDMISQFVRTGGTIAPPEDVGAKQFYEGVDKFSEVANNHLGPGLGNAVVEGTKFYKDLSQRFDHITWQRTMTGGKLITFVNMMEKELLRNQKNGALNPQKFRQLSSDEIARGLTPTINDFFGGQNWLRMSMDSSSEWMRNIKANIFKPNSRVWVQRGTFAPDWFVSNFRALSKTIPSWETFKDVMHGESNARTAMMKYHAYFAARAIFTYVMAADTINLLNSGHHIWHNKDIGTVELDPEGSRTINLDKALTDDIELVTHPIRRGYNAMGIVPKEIVEQVANKQYINFGPGSSPSIATWNPNNTMLANTWQAISSRTSHAVAKALPIAARVAFEGPQGKFGLSGESAFNAASGFFGFPIYEHKTNTKMPRFLAYKQNPNQ